MNIRVPAALPMALLALPLIGFGGAACRKRPDPRPTDSRPADSRPADSRPAHTAPAQVAGPPAPPQSAAELETPLARIDDVTITLGELQDRINRQSPYLRARYTSLEQTREFLDSLIRFEILAKEASRRGLDRDPEVARTMKQVMIQKLMHDEIDAKITADTITDAELRAYYDANLAEYVRPEEVRVSTIITKSRALAERVAREARGEAGKTNKGFRELVDRYSQDEDSKLRGGDLRYVDAQAKDVPGPVLGAAFALRNIGDVSGAVDAGDGRWYVLKQTGRRTSMTRSFDDVKPAIRNKLVRDKRRAAQHILVDALKAAAKIEIDEVNLAKVRIDTSPGSQADAGRGRDLPPVPLSTSASPPSSSPPSSSPPSSSPPSSSPPSSSPPSSSPPSSSPSAPAGKPEIP